MGTNAETIKNPIVEWIKVYNDIPGAFWLRLPPDKGNNHHKYLDALCIPFEYRNVVNDPDDKKKKFISFPKNSTFLPIEDSPSIKLPFEVEIVHLSDEEATRASQISETYYIPIMSVTLN